MDDFFDGFGNGSTQDNFDLAALQYFEEMDRQKGKRPLSSLAPESPEPAPAAENAPTGDPLTDMDSLDMMLMRESEGIARPARTAPPDRKKAVRKPPFVRQREETAQVAREERSSPEVPEKPGREALSALALDAAQLFQRLPAEDQLLAYTLLQKLAKAAED